METLSVRKALKKFSLLELIFWLFFLVSVTVKTLYFEFFNKINYLPFFEANNLNMLMASCGVLLMIAAIVILFFNKKRILVLLILDILLTLLLFSDTIYYRYYHYAITTAILYQLNLLGSLGSSIKGLFSTWDFIYILDFPFILAGMVMIHKEGVIRINFVKRLITALILFAIGITGFQVAYHRITSIQSMPASTLFSTDKNKIIKTLGVFYFHYYDVKNFIWENMFTNKSLTPEEKLTIEKFYQQKEKSGDRFRGIAKNKNLIVIQVESLQGFLINRSFNNKEITPNLNKLIKESAYFDNYYYQVSAGNTSDAEFLSNVSLYPAKEGAVYFRYPLNTYHTLPKTLKSLGYKSNVYHAYSPSFWNRTIMYGSVGFDTFYSNKDFKTDQILGWALSDESFFRQALDKIDTSKPFYDFFITLSSHYPNEQFEDFKNIDSGKYEKTPVGNYLKAVNYVDKCIGQFMDGLKKRDLYDNSLIVIYGDHFGLTKQDQDSLSEFLGINKSDLEWQKIQKVPLIIHYPGLKNGEIIHTTGGELDLRPTIANLMNIDASFSLGKDLFNTQNGYAVLRNGSYITDSYVYLSSTGEAYDIVTGAILRKEEYAKDLAKHQNELSISDIILQKNAFKSIK